MVDGRCTENGTFSPGREESVTSQITRKYDQCDQGRGGLPLCLSDPSAPTLARGGTAGSVLAAATRPAVDPVRSPCYSSAFGARTGTAPSNL